MIWSTRMINRGYDTRPQRVSQRPQRIARVSRTQQATLKWGQWIRSDGTPRRPVCQDRMTMEEYLVNVYFFFFQAEDGIRDVAVTGVQTCALPIYRCAVVHGLGDLFLIADQPQLFQLRIPRVP